MRMNKAELELAGIAPDLIRVTKAELAQMWGVSKANVTKIFKQPGAPKFGDDKKITAREANRYYMGLRQQADRRRGTKAKEKADAVRSSVAESTYDEMTIDEARRRKAVTEARLVQMEFDQARGGLIPRERVLSMAKADAAIIKSDLLALPARLTPEIMSISQNGPGGISAVIDAAIRQVLEKWSGGMAEEARRVEFGGISDVVGC